MLRIIQRTLGSFYCRDCLEGLKVALLLRKIAILLLDLRLLVRDGIGYIRDILLRLLIRRVRIIECLLGIGGRLVRGIEIFLRKCRVFGIRDAGLESSLGRIKRFLAHLDLFRVSIALRLRVELLFFE